MNPRPRDQSANAVAAGGVVLDGLGVSYGHRVAARDVSLHVQPGEWVGLIGPNGAGKSSVLRAIAGLEPSVGGLAVAGQSVRDLDRRSVARAIAFVAQSPVLPVGMSVADYVLLGRNAHMPVLSSESAHDRQVAASVIDRLDLAAFVDRPVDELSGGEAQRVVIARALAQEAPVLLLDEPTSALDVGHQQQVLDLLDELRLERDLTILSAMHDLSVAAQYASRLLLLSHGRAVAVGAPHEVLTREHLRDHFHARVQVLVDDDGHVHVLPTRAPAPAPAPRALPDPEGTP